jgi:hypothetical protein
MTRTAKTTIIPPFVPAPRRSPEEIHEPAAAPETATQAATDDYPMYPLVRYAMQHATALRPRQE